MNITITVNGNRHTLEVVENLLLVHLIREQLYLTGTHVGCDTSQCGACTVHLNGRAVKSCGVLALQADGAEITTIEGLGGGEPLHPMQAAFRECHGLQCGFCTPGMIMTALDLVAESAELDRAAVREGLKGNFCRCTGYHNIVDAVLAGAERMKQEERSR